MDAIVKKTLAKEFLILSSTIVVSILTIFVIVLWNSIIGQIDMYYSNKELNVYYLHPDFEASNERYWYGYKIYQNLIDGGYEVPSDDHMFIKEVYQKTEKKGMKDFYNILTKEGYVEETFEQFLNYFPKLKDLELRNDLYNKKLEYQRKSDKYFEMKLTYDEAKSFTIYSVLIWLILIYPLRGFIVMLKWSIKTLKI